MKIDKETINIQRRAALANKVQGVYGSLACKEIGSFDLFGNKLFYVENEETALSELELNPGFLH